MQLWGGSACAYTRHYAGPDGFYKEGLPLEGYSYPARRFPLDGDSGFMETEQLLEQATQQLKEEAIRWGARVTRGEELGKPFRGV